jgi:hypothetical protein
MAQSAIGRLGERRARVRYSHTLPLACRLLGQEAAPWTARIKNLSLAGAGLVMPHEVRLGAVLVVAMEGLGGRFSRPLLMRVLNVRAGDDGEWLAGCTFVKPLTDDDVQTLLLAKS